MEAVDTVAINHQIAAEADQVVAVVTTQRATTTILPEASTLLAEAHTMSRIPMDRTIIVTIMYRVTTMMVAVVILTLRDPRLAASEHLNFSSCNQ